MENFRPRKDILKNWGRSVFDSFIKYDSGDGAVTAHISPRGDGLVHFVNEGIVALIKQDAHRVDFYGADERYIRSAELPRCQGGREVYMDVRCGAGDGVIALEFPVYRWTDHYPHCDGESDRWTTEITGWQTMRWELARLREQ